MSRLCKSLALGGFFSAALTITACRGVDSFQPPGPQIAALPPANSVRALESLAPQPSPSMLTPKELSVGHNVSYAGWMTEQVRSNVGESQSAPVCVYRRPVSMRIERGNVTIWYVDWGGNTTHYHGKIDATGRIEAWHTNGDPRSTVLTGQITNNGFTGFVQRGIGKNQCAYSLTMREEAAASDASH